MATNTASTALPHQVQTVLDRLRLRIRLYVWIEGLALALIWCGIMFWVFLAIDYLPILVGATEMPVVARAIYLVIVVGGLGYVLYRWILRRAFVRLRNESMAVLLERHYSDFHDGLLTSVELGEHAERAGLFSRSMLAHTSDDMLRHLGRVRVGKVFRVAPLWFKVIAACLLLLSVVCFGVFASNAMAIAGQRLLFLSPVTWPRSARIEVLDFPEGTQTRKVARGSDFALRVRASTKSKVTPAYCWVYYRTDDGDRGRLEAAREGQPRDGYQYYVCREGPFDGVIDSISFDVLGYDHRLSDYRLEMVDSPVVVQASVYCEYPSYLVDDEHNAFQPQQKAVTTGTQLERGTKLTLQIATNKDLETASVRVGEAEPVIIELSKADDDAPEGQNPRRYFEYDLGTLEDPLDIQISLRDVDEVASQQPYRLIIGMIEDKAPQIDARLSGIGSAITPDARIPMEGTVVDDYGIQDSWLELSTSAGEDRRYFFSLRGPEIRGATIDLRDERSLEEDPLELEPGQTVTIVARASDYYDLDGAQNPNIGMGDRYELAVVSPDDLLRLLERRELELRGRFEQIVDETRLARDMLLRVKEASGEQAAILAEPGDSLDEPGDAEAESEARLAELRSVSLLRVQRTFQHSQKAGPEILGVALGFENIRQEIENNRIDAVERIERLQQRVADPLRRVSLELLPEWETQLTALEAALTAGDESASADVAIAQADTVLAEMERVLNDMLNMQDFNELVDMLRTMIDDQQQISTQTRELQQEEIRRLLE